MIGKHFLLIFVYFTLFFITRTNATILRIQFPSGYICLQNTEYMEDKCYLLFNKEENWSEASEKCRDQQGIFPIAEDEIDINYLCDILLESGFTNTWLSLRRQPRAWTWVDGGILGLNMWTSTGHTIDDEFYDCVAMVPADTYTWATRSCGSQQGYICETSRHSELCYQASQIFNEVLVSENRCFMVQNQMLSWHAARFECERIGATLAKVNTTAVTERFRVAKPGLRSEISGYWIGLSKAIWRSNEGEPNRFYWATDEPNASGNCSKCVLGNDGRCLWEDENCNAEINSLCLIDVINIPWQLVTPVTDHSSLGVDTREETVIPHSSVNSPIEEQSTTENNLNLLSTPEPTAAVFNTHSKDVSVEMDSTTVEVLPGFCYKINLVWIVDVSMYIQEILECIRSVINWLHIGTECYTMYMINMAGNTLVEFTISSHIEFDLIVTNLTKTDIEKRIANITKGLERTRTLSVFDNNDLVKVVLVLAHSESIYSEQNGKIFTSFMKEGIIVYPIILANGINDLALQRNNLSFIYFHIISNITQLNRHIHVLVASLTDFQTLKNISASKKKLVAHTTVVSPTKKSQHITSHPLCKGCTLLISTTVPVITVLITVGLLAGVCICRKKKHQNAQDVNETALERDESGIHLYSPTTRIQRLRMKMRPSKFLIRQKAENLFKDPKPEPNNLFYNCWSIPKDQISNVK